MANQSYSLDVPADPALPGAVKNMSASPNTSKTVVWSGGSRTSNFMLEGSATGSAPWAKLGDLRGVAGTLDYSSELLYVRLTRRAGSGGSVTIAGNDNVAATGATGATGAAGAAGATGAAGAAGRSAHLTVVVAGNGAGNRVAAGLLVGDVVDSISDSVDFSSLLASFEGTVTVAGHLQQTGTDLTGKFGLVGINRA